MKTGVARFGVYILVVVSLAVAGRLLWNYGLGDQQQAGTATITGLPISFEVNRGQAAADARFVARGGGYALLLTDRGEPVLALQGPASTAQPAAAERRRQSSPAGELRTPAEQVLLRLDFLGSNPAPQVQGEQPLSGHSNYLIGNDPGKWLTDVPHFARVRYREVYPGVDVLYYTKDQQLEYDFIVRPATNPDSIRLAMQGALEIEQSEQGSLVLKTAAGRAVLQKPAAYQEGSDGEREVACNYLLDKGEVRFALGDYDRSKVLRIDPVLSYSAPQDALIRAIAVDASGNSYLSGSTVSVNFPTTPGVFQPAYGEGGDALIAKLDPTGSTLLFATYLGGSGDDSADSIALDSSGNVFVAGRTRSANLPVNHAFQSTLLGNEDAFVSKLNATGTQLVYSTYLGGSGTDSARGVALDASGRTLVTGSTDSSNFPTSSGALQAAYGGGDADAFIAKLDTTQSGIASRVFSLYLGGSNRDAGGAIAVDATGNVFVTGLTMSSNFPTASPLQASCASCSAGLPDAFVTKLNATGTALVYSTFLGGNDSDAGDGIALDSVGNAYVAGTTYSFNNFPTTVGAFQTSPHGVADVFVSKLNAAGSTFVYSSFIGGDGTDRATGIALDSSGNAYLTGFSDSSDFPTVNPLQGPAGGVCDFILFPNTCSDAVVLKMNAGGSSLIYSTYLGKADISESGTGIAVDAAGNAYVAGATGISSFTDLLSLTRFGPPNSSSNGIIPSGFAAKISPVNAPGLGFDPQQVNFNAQPVGSTSGAVAVLLRNLGTATLNISNVSTSGDFAQTNNCGASVAGGSNCAVQLKFSPATAGPHNGMLVVNDNAAGSPHSIPLGGTGTQVVKSISLAATQTSTTVPKGGTATFLFTVSQAGALTSAVAFSCSGLPVGWNCGFNPMTVPAGSSPTQVTLTLQVGSATAQNLPRAPSGGPGLPGNIWPGFLSLLMLGIHLCARGRNAAAYRRPAVALGFASLLLLAAGCGSGSGSGVTPQPVTVNFMVRATSDSTANSIPFSVTVR